MLFRSNLLAEKAGKAYDDKGMMASSGKIIQPLLNELNAPAYYQQSYPKSLSNQFGLDNILPILSNSADSLADLLCTYTEHVAIQIGNAFAPFINASENNNNILVTGGGAFNDYLIERIQHHLPTAAITLPNNQIIQYKEALIMALLEIGRAHV